MDKLAQKLRQDAARIDARVSADLDERIRASLHNVSTEKSQRTRPQARPRTFWLASSLTGAVAALAIIALLDIVDERPAAQATTDNAARQFTVPDLDLRVEAAMLTSPLEDELANLQADLRKAEKIVRDDVELGF